MARVTAEAAEAAEAARPQPPAPALRLTSPQGLGNPLRSALIVRTCRACPVCSLVLGPGRLGAKTNTQSLLFPVKPETERGHVSGAGHHSRASHTSPVACVFIFSEVGVKPALEKQQQVALLGSGSAT